MVGLGALTEGKTSYTRESVTFLLRKKENVHESPDILYVVQAASGTLSIPQGVHQKNEGVEVASGLWCSVLQSLLPAGFVNNLLLTIGKQKSQVLTILYICTHELNKNVHDVNAKLVPVFVLSRVLHTEVRWLSKVNMLGRLFELRDEVMQFLENNKQTELYVEFRKPGVHVALAYLSDIIESLNTFNLKLQGGESNIIFHWDAIKAFTDKLLFGILEEARFQNDFKDTDTKSKISNHLQHLTDKFERYFPNSCDDKIYYSLATDPFHVDVDVLADRLQEEVLEIKNDSAAKYDFQKMDKPLFWVKYLMVYPSRAEQALKLYLPFSSTYLCERAFSAVVAIKNKLRSKLGIANDLRCAVSTIQPRIQNLLKNMQAYPSH
ncbi:SCAN domain-containing protein 3-like [Schistocerca nitens]|uniref:SCAN domain-containing protein 3-like n=1 Tax=Schistocerca nitens TaxID=7011 RepID=UPI00211803EE|nr:SCAN domain-containing protein 3-like [Schistocerca nitens]